jgi:hypothetical protein
MLKRLIGRTFRNVIHTTVHVQYIVGTFSCSKRVLDITLIIWYNRTIQDYKCIAQTFQSAQFGAEMRNKNG